MKGEPQLALTPASVGGELAEGEVLDGAIVVDEPAGSAVVARAAADAGQVALERRNLFGEAERIAGRAASAGTRRQYASIFRAFGDWLAGELGRPPVVADVDVDAIAAYGRHLAVAGGRGGGPASPATQRVYLSMVRSLARGLGRDDVASEVRVPRHEPGPPEALTDSDYANLLRVPDRRLLRGKRDYALLRVLGDCGLRGAELRRLRARDLRRPRSNGRHFSLYVRGKGGKEREVAVPDATQVALEAWLKVHPLARGVALRDEDALFVRVGKHAHEPPLPLSPSLTPPSIASSARTRPPPGSRGGSRTLTPCGPTGPRTPWRTASRSTTPRPTLATATSAPPPLTAPCERRAPAAWLTCSIAAIRRRAERAAGDNGPRPRSARPGVAGGTVVTSASGRLEGARQARLICDGERPARVAGLYRTDQAALWLSLTGESSDCGAKRTDAGSHGKRQRALTV